MNPIRLRRVEDLLLLAAGALPAILLALLLLAIALLPARAQDANTCPGGVSLLASADEDMLRRIDTQAAITPHGEGRLFRVEREGVAPSFLFGTMHLAEPRVLTLPAPVEAAFASARTVVVEATEIADERAVAAALLSRPDLTILPSGTTLRDLVPETRREELTAALEARGIPAGSVATLQPWFVTAGLAVLPCEQARQARGEAVLDLALAQRAETDGKTLAGLESAIEQMEALGSLPLDLQAETLLATLEMLDRLPDLYETMIALYLEGRIGAIAPAVELLAQSQSSSAAAYAEFEERVILTRNRLMAERVVPFLEEGAAFVAVGALHLPGEEGLVELLGNGGWRVTRAD